MPTLNTVVWKMQNIHPAQQGLQVFCIRSPVRKVMLGMMELKYFMCTGPFFLMNTKITYTVTLNLLKCQSPGTDTD